LAPSQVCASTESRSPNSQIYWHSRANQHQRPDNLDAAARDYRNQQPQGAHQEDPGYIATDSAPDRGLLAHRPPDQAPSIECKEQQVAECGPTAQSVVAARHCEESAAELVSQDGDRGRTSGRSTRPTAAGIRPSRAIALSHCSLRTTRLPRHISVGGIKESQQHHLSKIHARRQ
jgi:hypothetical protein